MSSKPEITNFKFYNLLFFPSILLVPALIAGPLISEIIIFSLIFFYSFLFLKNKSIFINPGKKLLIYIICFNLYLIFNAVFISVSIELSLKNSLFYFRFFFFSYIFFLLLNINEDKFFKYYLYIFSTILIIFFVDLISLTLFESSLSGNKFVTQRFSSLFGEEQVMGGFVLKLLPTVLICLILSEKKSYLYLFLLILISGILIVSSGERTSFGHFIIFLFFLFIHKKFFKPILIVGSIFSILFITLYFLKFYPVNRIVKATFYELSVDGRKDLILFSDVHENMLLTSYEIFKKNIIFGAGPKTYRAICGQDQYASNVREKIIKETRLYAKDDGYLFLEKNKMVNPVTLDPYEAWTAKIYYKNIGEKNLNLYRYRRDLGAVGKGLIVENMIEYYPKVNFQKDDLLAQMSYEREDGCDTHPHNLIAQIAAELGSIGLIFYLLFYFYLIKETIVSLLRFSSKNYLAYYISTISLLINFFPFLPSGNFFNNWYSTLLYIPLGFFMYFKFKLRR